MRLDRGLGPLATEAEHVFGIEALDALPKAHTSRDVVDALAASMGLRTVSGLWHVEIYNLSSLLMIRVAATNVTGTLEGDNMALLRLLIAEQKRRNERRSKP